MICNCDTEYVILQRCGYLPKIVLAYNTRFTKTVISRDTFSMSSKVKYYLVLVIIIDELIKLTGNILQQYFLLSDSNNTRDCILNLNCLI